MVRDYSGFNLPDSIFVSLYILINPMIKPESSETIFGSFGIHCSSELTMLTTVVALPKTIFKTQKRARWVSPDRGFRGEPMK